MYKDDEILCPHCGEITHIGGLIGPQTNDCPRCGKQALTTNTPRASDGLTTYRYRGRYGFIYIGASTDTEAMIEAQRSTDDKVTPDRLERYNGRHFVGVLL